MNRFKYIVLDPNPQDRIIADKCLSKLNFLESAGMFSNPIEVQVFLKSNKIAVLFISIGSIDNSKIGFLRDVNRNFEVVFFSNNPKSAVQAFDLDGFDFICKPLCSVKLSHCMQRLEIQLNNRSKSELFDKFYGDECVEIKDGRNLFKINTQEIIYLEAIKDYTRIITNQRKFTIRGSIGNILNTSNFEKFIRIHKSYATQRIFVESVRSNVIELNSTQLLPVGRKYKANLAKLF